MILYRNREPSNKIPVDRDTAANLQNLGGFNTRATVNLPGYDGYNTANFLNDSGKQALPL